MVAAALHSIGKFSDTDIKLFEEQASVISFKKDSVLLKEGAVCSKVYYCLTGSAYQYKYKNEIDLNIVDLYTEGDWMMNHRSFSSQIPSDTVIKAFTHLEVLELSMDTIHRLISYSPSFFQLGKLIEVSTDRLHFFDEDLDPTEKYKYILQHRPQILQAFPLKFLASYLKISPETISRVRERITRPGNSI